MEKTLVSVFVPRMWAVGPTHVNRRAHIRGPDSPRAGDEEIYPPEA